MYLDATYLHVRTEHGMVVSKAVVVVTGVTEPAAPPTADIEAGALAEGQHPDE